MQEETRRQALDFVIETKFARSRKGRRLLEHLWANREIAAEVSHNDLAAALYGDASDVGRARSLARVVRGKLEEGAADCEEALGVSVHLPPADGGYRLEFRIRSEHAREDPPSRAAEGRRNRWTTVAGVGLVTALLALLGAWTVRALGQGAPDRVTFEGDVAIVRDEQGWELGRHVLPVKSEVPEILRPPRGFLVAVGDIDRDGIADVAFGYRAHRDLGGAGVCVFDGATESFECRSVAITIPGARLEETDRYRPLGVRFRRDEDGAIDGILVMAAHWEGSLAYIRTYDTDLEVLDTYWMYGYPSPRSTIETDLDGDGLDELVLACRHDIPGEDGTGVLVFDPHAIRGFSPHPPDFARFPANAPMGSYRGFVVFPETDVTGHGNSGIGALWALPDGSLSVRVGERPPDEKDIGDLLYRLDARLRVIDLVQQYSFVRLRGALETAGVVEGPPDEAYFRDLRDRVRYFEGTGRPLAEVD